MTVLTNPQGHATTYTYHALNKVTQKVTANGAVTSHTYDAANWFIQLENISPVSGLVTRYTYTYDGIGNRVAEVRSTAR